MSRAMREFMSVVSLPKGWQRNAPQVMRPEPFILSSQNDMRLSPSSSVGFLCASGASAPIWSKVRLRRASDIRFTPDGTPVFHTLRRLRKTAIGVSETLLSAVRRYSVARARSVCRFRRP